LVSNTVYVALDLEATDMHPDRGEIIELGAIKFTDEKIVDRWRVPRSARAVPSPSRSPN
jgi:DNA polymerase III epsilon subunit-like protein